MTNEETVKRLKEARSTIQPIRYVDEAIDYAIKILEQEPCNDAISRQAVAQVLLKYAHSTEGKAFAEFLISQINDLPPVTPAEKVGRWIMHIDDLFPVESTMECDQCHEHQPITIDDNYCPNCGAKMVEPQESEES